MIHGPCGTLPIVHRPCMADGKCTKNFPKDMNNDTVTNVDGYPIYRRRNPEMADNHLQKYQQTQTLILTIVGWCHIRLC
ncbi:helitron_like_N domain-containing protein [Trichonephila clavipes]|nr:helitron_like_N domain-containing protein [Trichonephila clavipes]